MTQFNLLPDIKLEFMRVKRLQRTIMTISIAVTIVAFVLFIFMLLNIMFIQKSHITNLTGDIEKANNNLKATQGLDQILTVQNQLNSLDEAHGKKPAADRVLGYVSQVTPKEVSLDTVSVDFVEQTVTLAGSSSSLEAANQLINGLKFSTFTVKDEPSDDTRLPFSEVAYKDFSKTDAEAGKEPVSFTIGFKFDPVIFDNTKAVTLVVPSQTTSPSLTDRPNISTNAQGGGQ